MKKLCLLFLLFVLLFTSCQTKTIFTSWIPSQKEITGHDVGMALKQAANLALNTTMRQLVTTSIETIDFIPQDIKDLGLEDKKIPGFYYLMDEYKTYCVNFLTQRISEYQVDLQDLIEEFNFDSRFEMLESNTSLSLYLRANYYNAFIQMVNDDLKESFDKAYFDRIVSLYNDSLLVESQFSGALYTPIRSQCYSHISQSLVAVFFEEFSLAEQKVRTTPSLDLDSIYIRVFGLDMI